MKKGIAILLATTLCGLGISCSYPRALITYADHDGRLPLKATSWDGEQLGPVSASKGGAIWRECTAVAEGAVWLLIDEAERAGGNAVGDVRWLSVKKEGPGDRPTCKRKWAWFLIWPVLVTPLFESARVEGNAYLINSPSPARAGVYVIPAEPEARRALALQIAMETTP